MKTLLIFLILLLTAMTTSGQQATFSISGVSNKKISATGPNETASSIGIGKKITLISNLTDRTLGNCYVIKSDETTFKIQVSEIKKISFDKPENNDQLWQIVRINSDLDAKLSSKGFQYDLRKELEDETTDALQNFEKYYGFFKDDFIEDYIQTLLYKIHPVKMNDGRTGHFDVKILNLSNPDAFCMPTGTIVITTGLLSTIRSEDELIGILAHEVAHFFLDHQVENINKAVNRQKRAEFWAGFSTFVAAASEVYLADKYDFVPSGNLTFATAMLSGSIADAIIERIGTDYSLEQELVADNAASLSLTLLNKDPKSLSAALIRIQNYFILNRDFQALAGTGTFASLLSRITKIGETNPEIYNSTKYDRTISFVNTYNSINEYAMKHLETTIYLTNRNIVADVGTEDDYLLKAMAIRLLYNTPEKNQEALDLINKAKVLNINPNIYLFKQEAITLIHLGKNKEAGEAMKIYLENLENEEAKSDYIIEEIGWTRKMINKLSLL